MGQFDLIILLVFFVSQPHVKEDFFIDNRDNQRYEVVKIGTQTWMKQNLNYATDGSVCYNNDENNCKKYGRLYNFATAQKVCPEGWHLPSHYEWLIMEKYIGLSEVDSKKLFFRGTTQAQRLKRGGDTGFDAMYAGYHAIDTLYDAMGTHAFFWTSTVRGKPNSWAVVLHSDLGKIGVEWSSNLWGMSVRCLKNDN